jgi:benzil reductase ((S)-benzoin forming)
VDISSGAHKMAAKGWSIYCSTKAAGVLLHQTIAAEEDSARVRVLNYSPGILATDMQSEVQQSPYDSDMKFFLIKTITEV